MSSRKSVLITGVSGFLGGALGRHFREAGYNVTGISRRPPRANSVDRHFQLDLSHPISQDIGSPEIIVHAAALASPWARPADYRAHIINATDNVLEYARRTDTQQFIFVSTTAVYYRFEDQFAISEDTPFPVVPVNSYAATKREAESLVACKAPTSLIIRPRAIYGPGDTVLFPRILRAAKKGLLPEIRRADGSAAIADLIYIENLVDVIRRAVELKLEGAINVTDGQPQNTYELLTGILSRLGYRQPSLKLSLERAMQIARVAEWTSSRFFNWAEPPITQFGVSSFAHSKTFDVSKMHALLGPMPYKTEQGVAAFVDWQKSGAPL